MTSPADLAQLLAAVPGVVLRSSDELYPGRGAGLPVLEIQNAHGRAVLALQGAHLLSFVPQGGRDLLWLSPLAKFNPGKAIRGGIPLCLPWFGGHPDKSRGLPAHGFARTSDWQLESAEVLADGRHQLVLGLKDTLLTREMWPHHFHFRFAITVGSELTVMLEAEHQGHVPVEFTAAMHSYFAVPNVAECVIEGLAGCEQINTLGGITRLHNEGDVVIRDVHDSVYLDVPAVQIIRTPSGQTRIDSDTRSAIVWNPGTNALKGGDIGPAYTGFVCVERGDAFDNAITLKPGEVYRANMTISG
ncbi:D-hexose-6-phosphate mutarotase [Chitinilyticum piscinae]|uniref:Putative glucose-6-phosphate 1-epimerase n=1 Tax=Chitinilyticum piscinae TaxID=2866724 RepID=A0A8J7K260_9NEIS|nr:D-hexose-6-phosphate mutarotase [Chitinilyticum piscinae]MBE9609577.1 D-hexose-6-phosphate mutarotase [Chitinilyticum piscinae]